MSSAMNVGRLLRCTASARCFSAAEALRREPSRPHSLPHQQSRYENYDKTSTTYDNVRSPIGLPDFESVLSAVASRRGLASPRDLSCLDGGCGTGNYTHSLSKVVGRVTGVEPNEGMRAKARAKMAGAGVGNVEVLDGSLDQLPVRDASVDVVWITQVLHHLYDSSTTPSNSKDVDRFAPVRDAVAEVRRVLRPGGAFILQTQTPQQHRDGFWWAPIIPTASSRLAERFPELDWLEEEVLRPHGFDAFEEHIPSQPLMAIQFYANLGGPLLEEFRNGDSTWGLATEEELDRGLRDWGRRLLEDPVGAAEWFAERERLRNEIGQTTTFVAHLPL